MTARALSKYLTTAALALASTAAVRWHLSRPAEDSVAVSPPIPRPVSHGLSAVDSVDDAASMTVENDPFRLSNGAPTVRFSLADGTPSGPAPIAPPLRPAFVLKAIVGGPPWQAVIDGIPGQPPGTLAEPGKRFDKFVIRDVTRDSVIVQGPDTSWILSFRRRS